jgi:hypothetical protein
MRKNSTARKSLLKIQRSIDSTLRHEVERALGKEPKELERYRKRYEAHMKKVRPAEQSRLSIASFEEVLGRMKAARITLLGDHHYDPQHQRTPIRLLRALLKENPKELWVLGLELLSSDLQSTLDHYVAGRISLESLDEKVRLETRMGSVPWAPYRELCEFAKNHQVKLLALDVPERSHVKLEERDQWAAEILKRSLSRKNRILVLIGEYHLARGHLPAQLEEPLVLHQNDEKLYWRLAASGHETHAQAVLLRDGNFCLMSSPPWNRHLGTLRLLRGDQGVLQGSWEKNSTSETLWEEFDVEGDFIGEMTKLAQIFENLLGRPRVPVDFSKIHLLQMEDADFTHDPVLRRMVESNQRFFDFESQSLFLTDLTSNFAAEWTAIIWRRKQIRFAYTYADTPLNFWYLVLDHTFGFLFSLWMNPKRKCDQKLDHLMRLEELTQGQVGAYPEERKMRRLTLDLVSWIERYPEKGPPPRSLSKTGIFPRTLAARAFGQILGDLLFRAKLGPESLRDLWLRQTKKPESIVWELGERLGEEGLRLMRDGTKLRRI